MKVINEDIKNLERCIKDERVDVVGSMPITMADAFYDSEQVQDKIDKEMEEHNKETEVELNKVLGAEKQPVPDVPEVPKATLEESLFEDYEESTDLNETLQDERIKNVKKYLESALAAVNSYLERTTNEALDDDYDFRTDLTIDLEPADFDDYAIEDIKSVRQKLSNVVRYQTNDDADYFVLTFKDGTKKAWFIHSGMYIRDKDFKESLQEDTERDAYYDALDIPKGPERKKVAAERRQEFLKKFNLEDRAQEWKDAKGKDDPEEEEDTFTKINDELFPYDMEEVKLFTKFPGVSASKRYHSGEVTTDYDGNVIVHADAEDKFDFAKQVADAYGVEYEEPRNVRGEFIMRILTSKLED